jgi:hypothetical protein
LPQSPKKSHQVGEEKRLGCALGREEELGWEEELGLEEEIGCTLGKEERLGWEEELGLALGKRKEGVA